jgi:hypothetical protein
MNTSCRIAPDVRSQIRMRIVDPRIDYGNYGFLASGRNGPGLRRADLGQSPLLAKVGIVGDNT